MAKGAKVDRARINRIVRAARESRNRRSNSPVGRGARIRRQRAARAERELQQTQGRQQTPRASVRRINGRYYRTRTNQFGRRVTPVQQAAAARTFGR